MIKLLKKIIAFLEKREQKELITEAKIDTVIMHPDFLRALERGEIEAVPVLDFVGKDGIRHQYHRFANMGQDIYYTRFDQAREFEFQHSEIGINRELLNERLNRAKKALDITRLNSFDERDFREASQEAHNMLNLIQSSLAFGSPIDKTMDVMSCLYVEKDESPYTYNRMQNLDKIKVWFDNYDKVESFFLQSPFLSMLGLPKSSAYDSLSATLMNLPKEAEELEKLMLARMNLVGDLNEKIADGTSEMLLRHSTMLNRIGLNERLRLNTTNTSE